MDWEALFLLIAIVFGFGCCAVDAHDDAVTKRELESACITARGNWLDGHCQATKP